MLEEKWSRKREVEKKTDWTNTRKNSFSFRDLENRFFLPSHPTIVVWLSRSLHDNQPRQQNAKKTQKTV